MLNGPCAHVQICLTPPGILGNISWHGALMCKARALKRESGKGDLNKDPMPEPPPRLYAVWDCDMPLKRPGRVIWEGHDPSRRKPGDRLGF